TVFKRVSVDLGVKHFKLSMTIMRPGQKIPLHSHPTAEEVHLLMNGKSTVTVDGEKVKAEAITAFYFSPGSNYGLNQRLEGRCHVDLHRGACRRIRGRQEVQVGVQGRVLRQGPSRIALREGRPR